ncbi:MAG: PrsW family intramembrane metalloprotease [Candidatus Latescibacteria bacterium]|nr:PrsW family intramembrane metalloprotease [Candidatus Latescibacterota bacterium]
MTYATIALAAAVLPALFLLWTFHRRDRYPEPTRVVLKTFALGVVSVVPILVVAVPASNLVEQFTHPYLAGLGTAFLGAAIPEESFKYLIVVYYCARHSAFDEPMDGLVYGTAASLGFAALENILYVSSGGLGLALLRAFTAVPAHAAMGAIMGYYIGEAHFAPDQKAVLYFKAWAVPVLVHGLYDFPLLTLQHLSDPPAVESLLLGLGAIAVLIWTWRRARRLSREVREMQDTQAIYSA